MPPSSEIASVLPPLLVLAACDSAPPVEPLPRPDVLVVTVDTQRADRMGCYGYDAEDITPRTDQFATEAILFERHYAQAPMTMPSHASIFTGMYPYHHGVRSNGRYQLDASALTLAEVLSDAGYETAAIISSGVLHPVFGLAQGFDHYSWEQETGSQAKTDAPSATRRAIEWLDEAERGPFFLWVHYFDPHGPYKNRDFPDHIDFSTPYENGIAFADEYVGKLLDHLRQMGRYDDAVIAITSDHGQNWGEHDYEGHTLSLYHDVIDAPLLLRLPGGELAGQRVDAITRGIDLMPTLLSAVGIGAGDRFDGRDLSAALFGREDFPEVDAYSETHFTQHASLHKKALVSGTWKLISNYQVEPGSSVRESLGDRLQTLLERDARRWAARVDFESGREVRELYRIDTDPDETSNLYLTEPDVAARLEARLAEQKAREGYRPTGHEYVPSGDMKADLQALGYL